MNKPERIPLPWCRQCLVCGEDNPIGLRARSYKVGDCVQLGWTTRAEHFGWSNVMHGGFVATVLDEVMTWAAILGSDKPCFAAEFSVRMLETLAAEVDCIAHARMTQARRRVFDTESWLEDNNGNVYARGTGRYMPVPRDRMAHMRDEFVSSPACLDVSHIFGTGTRDPSAPT